MTAREGQRSPAGPLAGQRICVVYDCLFPWTLGGAERWYRSLVEGLVAAGAEVTYLTRLQWEEASAPAIPGVKVVAASRREALYLDDGTRKTLPPLRFGWGVFVWLMRHRSEFDAVHIGNFPYFSVIGARLALAGTNTRFVVDWFEVWPRKFWMEYAGTSSGLVGYFIQELCIRLSSYSMCFWGHTDERLRARKGARQSTVLAGLLPPRDVNEPPNLNPPNPPIALFVGRHIKDKGLRLLPETLRFAKIQIPRLRLAIVGEGPETSYVLELIDQLKLQDAVDLLGRVSDKELAALLASASCIVVASTREGYGMMVPEAAAFGTPSVVADNPENAATGHIVSGVNGFVVDPTPEGIARGILQCVDAGPGLRASTADWFAGHADAMSVTRSIAQVVDFYARSRTY